MAETQQVELRLEEFRARLREAIRARRKLARRVTQEAVAAALSDPRGKQAISTWGASYMPNLRQVIELEQLLALPAGWLLRTGESAPAAARHLSPEFDPTPIVNSLAAVKRDRKNGGRGKRRASADG